MKVLIWMLFFISFGVSALSGVLNGGGGNTYQGKPLESYAVEPKSLESYQQFIVPILEDIKSKTNNQNSFHILISLIESIFEQKIWYFVPGPIQQIPNELLNSAVQTDQAVIQTLEHVWVDKDIWSTIPVSDQGKLLLHEVYMGFKLLQFASDFRLCRAAYSSTNCVGRNQIDGKIQLSAKDYVDVQGITIETINSFSQLKIEDWNRLFAKYSMNFPYDWFDDYAFIAPEELKDLLSLSAISGYLPEIGYNLRNFDTKNFTPEQPVETYYQEIQNNREVCKVSAEIENQNLKLKVSTQTEKFEELISIPDQIKYKYQTVFGKDLLKQIGASHITQKISPSGGYTMYNIFLAFDSYRLSTVFIQEMVCQDPLCKRSPYIDAKGGMALICSDNPHLFRTKE